MTDTFTLVHLSDVHLGPITGFHPRYWNAKRGFGFINWQRGRVRLHRRSVADRIAADALAHNPDHIAVTGDLANLGLPGEYAGALAWLEALGSPARVSVVPGNHDIYSGRASEQACFAAWGAFMRGNGVGDDGGPVRFPYVKTYGRVALIGLNSAEPTPPFVAAGKLGAAQIAALGEILERLGREGFVRVVMIHHPPLPGLAPPRRALKDAAALAAVLDEAGAELVLHGHNHRDMLAWRIRTGGGVPVLGVASASAARSHEDEPLARYHLIRITFGDGPVRIHCETRGLGTADGEMVSLVRVDLTVPPAAPVKA